jgi:hypothetical protein
MSVFIAMEVADGNRNNPNCHTAGYTLVLVMDKDELDRDI